MSATPRRRPIDFKPAGWRMRGEIFATICDDNVASVFQELDRTRQFSRPAAFMMAEGFAVGRDQNGLLREQGECVIHQTCGESLAVTKHVSESDTTRELTIEPKHCQLQAVVLPQEGAAVVSRTAKAPLVTTQDYEADPGACH